jgi:hypothetical protein
MYSEELGIVILNQQYSPVARYWRKRFRRAEMEMKIGERYAISAEIGVHQEKRKCWAFSGERGSTRDGDWN